MSNRDEYMSKDHLTEKYRNVKCHMLTNYLPQRTMLKMLSYIELSHTQILFYRASSRAAGI